LIFSSSPEVAETFIISKQRKILGPKVQLRFIFKIRGFPKDLSGDLAEIKIPAKRMAKSGERRRLGGWRKMREEGAEFLPSASLKQHPHWTQNPVGTAPFLCQEQTKIGIIDWNRREYA